MPGKLPLFQKIDGLIQPVYYDVDSVRSAMNYIPNPGDLFIVTYPKCGTTWMQHIVCLIQRRGKFFDDSSDFFESCPFIDMFGVEAVHNMRRPGSIKTHLPVEFARVSSSAKYIYVLRNPRDCLTSYYHQIKMLPGYNFQDGTMDDLFELFVKGEVECNDYFDHMLGWYAHRNDPNFFVTTFEDMKKDPKDCVLKVAKFMGDEYEDMLIKDPEIINEILYKSSIDFMKTHTNDHLKDFFRLPYEEAAKLPNVSKSVLNMHKTFNEQEKQKLDQGFQFIRKGVVGDYKAVLSQEQISRLNERFAEKLKGVPIPASWEKLGFK